MAQRHRISAGALVVEDGRLLLVRHFRPGIHDFWVPPGGGVEGSESAAEAAARETFEETGLRVRIGPLAYIEELYDEESRGAKFWFAAIPTGGSLDIGANPAPDESIIAARWFSPAELATIRHYPPVLGESFWTDLAQGFALPRFLSPRRLKV